MRACRRSSSRSARASRPRSKFDQAIAAWETADRQVPRPASRPPTPSSRPPRSSRPRRATRAEAIERFKKIAVEPWKSQAQPADRRDGGEAPARRHPAHVPLGRRRPTSKITTRNLEKLTLHRLQAQRRGVFPQEARPRRTSRSLDIGLVAPDAAWTVPVPGYARYKPVEATYDLKKLELPGVYVVKVTDEKTLQATTLVIGSDLDAIVKTSRDQILVFAQDMKTGQGRAGARVLVADGRQVVLEAKTGQDGVLLQTWDPPRGAEPAA